MPDDHVKGRRSVHDCQTHEKIDTGDMRTNRKQGWPLRLEMWVTRQRNHRLL